MTTPTGRTVLGIYDHAPPADSAITGKEIDSNVTPFKTYNRGVERTIRLAAWITKENDYLQELLSSL